MKDSFALALYVVTVLIGIFSGLHCKSEAAKVNSEDEPWKPFHVAIQEGNVQKVLEIIGNYTNIDIKDKAGRTPLLISIKSGQNKIAEILINNGADINIKDKSGQTPLIEAVEQDNDQVVFWLLRQGANKTVTNKNGLTSLDIATSKANSKVIEVIRTTKLRPAIQECRTGLDHSTVEFPWMATLGYTDRENQIRFKCGGAVISDLFILTSAYCVFNKGTNMEQSQRPHFVRLGSNNLIDVDGINSTHNYKIQEIIIHPKFTLANKKNDIALIRVAERIRFGINISSACLHTDLRDAYAERIYTTAWSDNSHYPNEPSELQTTPFDTQPLSYCNSLLLKYNREINKTAPEYTLSESQYCTNKGILDPVQAASPPCNSDTVGPLQFYDTVRSVPRIVGIPSYGTDCDDLFGRMFIPAVFTRVAYYLNWIEAIVWPQSNANVA